MQQKWEPLFPFIKVSSNKNRHCQPILKTEFWLRSNRNDRVPGRKQLQIAKRRRRRMVLNSGVVMRVAHVSARLCQYIACNPEILRSDAVLGLIFCLPLQRLFFSLSSYLGYRTPHSDWNWNQNRNLYPYGESLLYMLLLL